MKMLNLGPGDPLSQSRGWLALKQWGQESSLARECRRVATDLCETEPALVEMQGP